MTARMTTIVHVVPHTHWDREWYEPFEGYRYRLVKVLDRLLDVVEGDPAFRHFNFDGQTAAIEDYLDVRPDARERIASAVADGRIACGPWRILMDEFLCSGETIVRNIRQGTRFARSMGRSMEIGYIPDSFGHIAQMPQILRLAGLERGTVWRGVPNAVDRTVFRWEAPDGSWVRSAYLVTSYSNAASLPSSVEELLPRARRIASDLAPYEPGDVVLAMNGTDHRAPEAHLPELFAKANAMQDEFEFRIGSMEEYLAAAPSEELPVWRGEMKSGARANLLPGVASARMYLKQAEFTASALLERYAEPLVALTGGDPGLLLERAWRWMVENSAHDSICGCGIDAVADQVHARYVQAARIADLVAADALVSLASMVDSSGVPHGGEGSLVWNPSPRPRSGVAEVTLTPPVVPFAMRAPDGSVHATQVLAQEQQVVVDMTLRGAQLAKITPTIHSRQIGDLFINDVAVERGKVTTVRMTLGPVADVPLDVEAAKREVEEAIERAPRAKFRVLGLGPPLVRALVATPAVGALGWTTLVPVATGSTHDGATQNGATRGGAGAVTPVRAGAASIENELVRADVGADGTVTVTHLRSGARYEGCLRIEDGGDAGDEYNYSPPERTDHVVNEPLEPAVVETLRTGPVEAALRITRSYRIPVGLSADERSRSRRTTILPVVTEIAVRTGEPFVRATIELRNEAKDHRIRALFPLGFAAPHSDADTAFHVTQRSLEAEGGVHEAAIPTYPCRRWVDASDGTRGLAVAHRGTPEYELVNGDTIAVTLLRSVAWLSRQGMKLRAGPAGPKLPTPGAQCLGSHRFELAIYPHEGDWRTGDVHAVAESFAYPFRATVVRPHGGKLPAATGAIAIEPASVQLSALHKDGDATFVRVYNASDEPAAARIELASFHDGLVPSKVNVLGEDETPLQRTGRTIELPLRAWEIATIKLAGRT